MSHIKNRLSLLGLCAFTLLITATCVSNKSTSTGTVLTGIVSTGTVIILNGPSAVGKSSIIKAFQDKQNKPWLGMGIDNLFVGVVSMKFLLDPSYNVMQGFASEDEGGKLFTLHIGSEGQKIIKGMHRAIATYAREGNNVIVDYITYDPAWIADLQSSLKDIKTMYVGVTASLDTIQQREKARGTSPEGHGRSLHESVHHGWQYDFMLDTDAITAQQAADQIMQRINNK